MMSVSELTSWLNAEGLPARTFTFTQLEELDGHLPAIIHLSEGHFVVVTKLEDGEVKVIDPTYGPKIFANPRADFAASTSGFAINVER